MGNKHTSGRFTRGSYSTTPNPQQRFWTLRGGEHVWTGSEWVSRVNWLAAKKSTQRRTKVADRRPRYGRHSRAGQLGRFEAKG